MNSVVAYQKLWWKGVFLRGRIRSLYEVNTRSAYMVCPCTYWDECNRHTFHHLLYLHYFSFIRIAFVHLAFISFILHSCFCFVFMSFQFNFMSFDFDDPRSGMFNLMSVQSILNPKGTAFTWMLSTREQLYFIPPALYRLQHLPVQHSTAQYSTVHTYVVPYCEVTIGVMNGCKKKYDMLKGHTNSHAVLSVFFPLEVM